MKRRFYIIAAVILAAAFLLGLDGLQLADETADGSRLGDELIGAFVTTEYLDLFDIEAYLNANAHKLVSGENIIIDDAAGYEGRIYAELVEFTAKRQDGSEYRAREYEFTGLEGMYGYAPRMYHEGGEGEDSYEYRSNTGNMEMHLHVKNLDGAEELEIESVLYVSTEGVEDAYYVNPVYQSSDGRVYLTSGSGMWVGGTADRGEGELWTQNMTSTFTETINGESVTSTNKVSVKLELVQPTKHVGIAFMDASHDLIDSLGYAPDTVPEELDVSGAEYIIVETYGGENGHEVLDRKVYGPEDETASYYLPMENGVCGKRTVKLLWE